MTTKKLLASLVLGATVLLGSAPSAEATPITGGLTITGMAGRIGASTWGAATGVNFLNNPFRTVVGTGTFAGIPIKPAGTFTDFSFSPFVAVPSLFTLTPGSTFSFDLSTLVIATQLANHIILTGTGILHATGFDPTAAAFTFESNSAVRGEVPYLMSVEAIDAVPEPGSMILLGTGLAGIATTVRRRWSQRRA